MPSSLLRRSEMTPDDHILIGVVRGVRGLRGELRVEPTTYFLERYESGRRIFILGNEHQVIGSREYKKGLILLLSDIQNREDAERCVGKELTVPSSEAIRAPKDSYFHYQIFGLKVYRENSTFLGEIVEIIQTGANDVYVVSLNGQQDILLPVIPSVIINVDLDENKMVVSIPLGLDR